MIQETDVRLGWTSASNAGSDRLCEGRHQAQKGLPDIPNEWSGFGDHVHAALADSGNTSLLNSLTPEERDAFDNHRELEKQIITRIWPGDTNPTKVLRHERYWCKVPQTDKGTVFFHHSGEADFTMIRRDKILIQDYKSMSGTVAESPRNEQLRDLAVMAWRTFGSDIFREVYVVINQPMVTWTPELCMYTPADLIQAEQEMWERVRNSNKLNPTRTAGEVQCKFCKASNLCKEHAVWRASLAPPEVTPLVLSMSDWTVEQRTKVAEHLPRLRKLLDDAEDFLKARLKEDPASVPGFFLKDGVTRHVINDPQELFNRFSTLGGQLEQFMKCVKITKENLEGEIRAITKTKGKGLKAEMDKILLGITDPKQNQPSLARRNEP